MFRKFRNFFAAAENPLCEIAKVAKLGSSHSLQAPVMHQNAFQSDRREAKESVLTSTGAEGDSTTIAQQNE